MSETRLPKIRESSDDALIPGDSPLPVCDVVRQYTQLQAAIDDAMQRVAARGNYILGPEVAAFEKEIADYCGCRFAVAVGNGTDALHLALRALGIGPGDEVITTPFTFAATTEAIGIIGATPVFVDIAPQTFHLNPDHVADAITSRTRAILPVHLYGQPCDMDPLLSLADRHGLAVIEDCAQALGARYRGRHVGSLGTAGCLSFFPSKNLGCMGDGGMIVTNDRELRDRAERLRRHGAAAKYYHEELGINSRLDELQAAILRVKLPWLDTWNRHRREIAMDYNRQFRQLVALSLPRECTASGWIVPPDSTPLPPDGNEAVYHQYTIRCEQRDDLQRKLTRAGIQTAIYYPVPLHLQKVHHHLGCQLGQFPEAERAAATCLSLPIFPGMTRAERQRVADVLHHSVDLTANFTARAA